MNHPVVLLVSADRKLERAVTEAARKQRYDIRLARDSQEAFGVLNEYGAEIDLGIVDLHPSIHGSAILEATAGQIPIIAVTSLEEAYARPLAERHGAVACLARPFEQERMAREIAAQMEKIHQNRSTIAA